MRIADAITSIRAPQGFTSVVSALMTGNLDPISSQNAVGASLADAEARHARVQEAQRTCTSDWAWWGYQGELSYWAAVVSLLKAAELVGADSLPDVQAPKLGGILMDDCSKVERFGNDVFQAAKRAASGAAPVKGEPT